MQKVTLTLCCTFLLVTAVSSQSVTEAVKQAKLELYTCTVHLNELINSLDSLKTTAYKKFEMEEQTMSKEKIRLQKRRVILSDLDRDKVAYNEWSATFKERKQLLQAEEALSARQQKLEAEKMNFMNKMNQIETDIQITIANEINSRIMLFTKNIKTLNKSIQHDN